MIRRAPSVWATKDTAQGEKCLFNRQNQAILTADGRPLGESRLTGAIKMADLILLTFGNGKAVRCTDLDDAKSKALSIAEGRILVEITSNGRGGRMTTLEFDRNAKDWISA